MENKFFYFGRFSFGFNFFSKIACTVLAVCSFLVLWSCGFHLRGQVSLPSQLQTIAVRTQAPYSDFTKQLERRLTDSNIRVVETSNEAPYILQILSENTDRNLSSVADNTQVRQYTVSYRVEYQLTDAQGQVIDVPGSLSTNRTYTAQISQLLGASNEQNTLEREMHREIVTQLLYRLNSSRMRKALLENQAKQHGQSLKIKTDKANNITSKQ